LKHATKFPHYFLLGCSNFCEVLAPLIIGELRYSCISFV